MCRCPKCGSDLSGPAIKPHNYLMYGYEPDAPATCRDGCGKPPHYSRLVGIYDTGRDRTAAWHCPDCGETWPR